MTGGPARRQREMLRRLEELDALDRLARTADEVVWPDGSSRTTDPRTWSPGRVRAPARRRSTGRRGVAVLVIATVALLAVVRLAGPGWLGLGRDDPIAQARADLPPLFSGGSARALPEVPAGPAPDPSTFAFLVTRSGPEDPVTFSPCDVIGYAVEDTKGAGDQGLEVVRRAVARVSLASGLAFTEEADPAAADVVIAWSDPVATPKLGGRTIGLARGSATTDARGRAVRDGGEIFLDAPHLVPGLGTADGADLAESTVVHELGHVLGADHPTASDQLMSETSGGSTRLEAGDRYAFARLGAGSC